MRAGSTTAAAATTLWPLLQQTAAAVLAWLVATSVVGHREPFFAPMAAVVSLNATPGERGSNAVRLLLGVFVGIAIGELTVTVLGRGYGRLAIATFTAMTLARVLDSSRIVVAQAAASAILTVVALKGSAVGVDRLIDALIGGGIALTFTQVLFSPEPVHLVRRAEAAGLVEVGAILELIAQALERDDCELAERAVEDTRELRNRMLDLDRARRAGSNVHRHSVRWRSDSRADAMERETERARNLDLLSTSCIMLARTSFATRPAEGRVLVPNIRELADAIGDLATKLEDGEARRHAANRALGLARTLSPGGNDARSALAASATMLEIATVDFMTFAGIDPGQARGRQETGAP